LSVVAGESERVCGGFWERENRYGPLGPGEALRSSWTTDMGGGDGLLGGGRRGDNGVHHLVGVCGERIGEYSEHNVDLVGC
jgi:hypothetical protein